MGGDPTWRVSQECERKLFETLPRLPDGLSFEPPTWDEFHTILQQAHPTKAAGPDGTTKYLLTLLPEPLLRWLHELTHIYWDRPLPLHWKKASIFLLPKQGDPTDPNSYRPIALLNTLYKIIATHANNLLRDLIKSHPLLSPTQLGFQSELSAQDHIFSVLANLENLPSTYHLYIDIEKAFNSVVQPTLWRLLQRLNLPPRATNLIHNLYQHATDFPIVNGHSLSSYPASRGLRQGCPLSPTLFNLYFDPVLRQLATTLNCFPNTNIYAFADDVLIQSPHPAALGRSIKILQTTLADWGLRLNTAKTELHAMGNASALDICDRGGTLFQSQPSPSIYKYLGVYISSAPDPAHAVTLAKTDIIQFFSRL